MLAGRISVVPGGVRVVGAVPESITWAWVAGAIKIGEREATKANRMVETCEFIIFMVFSQGQNRCTAIGIAVAER